MDSRCCCIKALAQQILILLNCNLGYILSLTHVIPETKPLLYQKSSESIMNEKEVSEDGNSPSLLLVKTCSKRKLI